MGRRIVVKLRTLDPSIHACMRGRRGMLEMRNPERLIVPIGEEKLFGEAEGGQKWVDDGIEK